MNFLQDGYRWIIFLGCFNCSVTAALKVELAVTAPS